MWPIWAELMPNLWLWIKVKLTVIKQFQSTVVSRCFRLLLDVSVTTSDAVCCYLNVYITTSGVVCCCSTSLSQRQMPLLLLERLRHNVRCRYLLLERLRHNVSRRLLLLNVSVATTSDVDFILAKLRSSVSWSSWTLNAFTTAINWRFLANLLDWLLHVHTCMMQRHWYSPMPPRLHGLNAVVLTHRLFAQ